MTVSQAAFRAALLNPDAAVPEGLTDPKGQPAGRRFDVYRNTVVVGLCTALEQAFPVVARLVGPDLFRHLAQGFVRAHPPETPVLMLYGAALPGYLEGYRPVRHLGYLPDVARLEQALRDSYHAADAPPLDPAALTALDADRLARARLHLAPTVRLVRSDWPIVAIWRFNAEDGPRPAMQAEAALVTRPGHDPHIAALAPADAAFVAALLGGAPLGTAVAAGGEGYDPTNTLALLLSGGALIASDTEVP